MLDIKKTVLKYALQNAVRYKGKAQLNNVISKVIGEIPSVRSNMKYLLSTINNTINEVNSLTQEKQIKKLQDIAPELLEDKPKEEKKLKELNNIKKSIIMRFAPSPSGPMHIGHAYTGSLSSLYVNKYGGKFYLRIEDTNPENISPEAYQMIKDEGEWLFGNVIEYIIQSDRMDYYYKYAEKLLDKDAIYICTCSPEKFKTHSINKKDCPCRNLKDQKQRWKNMFSTFKPGEAVVRFKSNMQHKNPAMRDFPLFRINDSKHPKQGKKYRVWPLMNMSVTVDDIEYKMTHIIRAKDHADNAKKQEMIFKVLKKPIPETIFLGRINFQDLELSCTKTKEKIKQKKFSDWDDIQLPFLAALKKRGYQPKSFLRFSKEIGISSADKVMGAEEYFKTLSAFNREILDPKSDRYFFIPNPIKITIKNAPKQTINIRLHPNNPKRGKRKLKATDEFYLDKKDIDSFKDNSYYRLMECLNFKKEKNRYVFDSKDIMSFKNKGKQIIHWLPKSQNLVNVEVLMPNNKIVKGLAESSTNKLKQGDIIQFERFGFCRLNEKLKNKLVFWFAHK